MANAKERFLKYLSCIQCGSDENLPAPVTEFDRYLYALACCDDTFNDQQEVYIVGDTALAADWLSKEEDGEPLTPNDNVIYIIVSAGAYINKLYRWGGEGYIELGNKAPDLSDVTEITITTNGQEVIPALGTTKITGTGRSQETYYIMTGGKVVVLSPIFDGSTSYVAGGGYYGIADDQVGVSSTYSSNIFNDGNVITITTYWEV